MYFCFRLVMMMKGLVLEGEPWCFDYSLLVLKIVENLEAVDMEDFCYTNFWV